MANISVSLPSDGETIDAADYNTPINTIVNEINGNLDNSNIDAAAAIAGSKLADEGVTASKINFGGSGSGVWWEEIGRTTLGSAGDTISVASLPARKYLKVIVSTVATGGTAEQAIRFNADTGSNYARRISSNGAADTTGTAGGGLLLTSNSSQDVCLSTFEVLNISNQEKLVVGQSVKRNSSGAGSIPDKWEFVGKWANTSSQISQIEIVNGSGTGDYAIGSEIVVLGHD